MVRYFRELVPLKPGEGVVTALMFAYIFGVLTLYYILEPLRAGLFLRKVPSSQLPYMYFLIAFVAGAIAVLTFKLSKYASAISIMTGTTAVIFLTLFYFRLAMGREIASLPYVFYLYVKIVSVLTTAQFWLLAGYIYDNRQAKRIYSVLGAGASLGAVAGSLIPAFLSQRLSTQSMLLICMAICVMLMVIGQLVWRHRRSDAEMQTPKASEAAVAPWGMILESRHLSMMVMLIFLTLITSQIADWQLMDVVQKTFRGSADSINGFFGRFNLITNALTILVQFFITGLVVSRLGVFATIVFLPGILFMSSLGIFLFPALITAAIARGADTVSRYTLNRSGIEMLYLPLAPIIRKKLKVFLDVFVDRTGRAVAGVVILIFISPYFPYGLRGTAAVAMALTFTCVLACLQLRKTYVQAFRQQLMRREIELGDVAHFVSDPGAVPLLVGALESTSEQQILYALQLLHSVKGVDLSPQLLPLLSHPSPHIREEAVRTLQVLPGSCIAEARQLAADPAVAVRIAVVDYLATQGIRPTVTSIRAQIATDGVVAAASTVYLPSAEASQLLLQLIEDSRPDVAGAAAVAAGKGGQIKLVFNAAAMLSNRQLRGSGRTALLAYGERVTGTLGDLLADRDCEMSLRREIPWVLARIPSKRSLDLLIDRLDDPDPQLRFRVLKALNRLHETNPNLAVPSPAIASQIRNEARDYYDMLAITRSLDGKTILSRAATESLDRKLDRLFRMLGMIYPQKEIYSSYLALKGTRPDKRTAAIEFLDNVLSNELRPIILPMLEGASTKPISRADGLKQLSAMSDPWLAACARYETGEPMTIIERVLLLQGIELFSGVKTEPLSYVAGIAEERTVEPSTTLYRENDPADGFYVVVSGTILVKRGGEELERIGPKGSFGVWALFDDQPRMNSAEACEAARLLFVRRDDFYDVLVDHVDLVQGIFRQLVHRVRRLAAVGEK